MLSLPIRTRSRLWDLWGFFFLFLVRLGLDLGLTLALLLLRGIDSIHHVVRSLL